MAALLWGSPASLAVRSALCVLELHQAHHPDLEHPRPAEARPPADVLGALAGIERVDDELVPELDLVLELCAQPLDRLADPLQAHLETAPGTVLGPRIVPVSALTRCPVSHLIRTIPTSTPTIAPDESARSQFPDTHADQEH